VEHRVDVLDLVGRHLAGRHHFVDLVDRDVATLLGGLDHLLHAGIGEIKKRQRGIGRAFFLLRGFFFFFRLRRLCLASHSASPGPSWPCHTRRAALGLTAKKGRAGAGAAPESGHPVSSEPSKLRLTKEDRWNRPFIPTRLRCVPDPQKTGGGPYKLRTPRPEEAPKPSIRASVPSIRDRRALTSRKRK